jgi:subfamily B ATP-binding cassette protein MsbA
VTDATERQRGDLLRAVRYAAGHRPLFTAAIAALSAGTALLSGIGVGFIVPIVELAQAEGSAAGGGDGLTELFVTVYELASVPLTLETAILGVALVLATQHSLSFASGYLRAILRMEFVRELRLEASAQALDARVGYYDDHGSDEIINAIVTQSNYAGGFINNGVTLLQQVLVAVVYLAVAYLLAPQLTLVTTALFTVVAAGVRFVFGSGYDAGEEVAAANESVQRAVQAGAEGVRAVKLFGLRDRFYDEIESRVDRHADAVVQLSRNRTAFSEFYQLVSALTVFALLYLGLAIFSVPLAQLAAFLFAMFRLAPMVSGINDVFYRAEGDLPHVVRMREFTRTLSANTEPTTNEVAVPYAVEELVFKDVRFAYDDEPVLRGMSLDIEAGEFVALVGQSGAGKSTVVSLLARFYEPDAGRITANGQPIDEMAPWEWRERVAVVRQQPYVFNETLRFNLLVGNRDASTDEIERACEIAQVTEFLDDLPAGYDTDLGDDGVRLSGGQRQRVALARALLKDADVLVLDEATSDLDTGLEAKVHRAIEEMDRDVATVAIAHRLSTVINADRIHVFDSGEIAETGTHEELLSAEGEYAALYASQARA